MNFADNVRLLIHSIAFAGAGAVLAYIVYGGPIDDGTELVRQTSNVELEMLRQAVWFYSANGIWIGWVVGCLTLIAQKLPDSKSIPKH